MFEYEIDSNQEEEKKQYDYDFDKEEFLNPIVVKGPDGTVSIGTECKDDKTKEAMCWNCQAHIMYNQDKLETNKVYCFKCKEENIIEQINNSEKTIIKCQKQGCAQSLLAPSNAYRIFCPACNYIFVNPKHVGVYHKVDVMHFFT